MTAELRTSRGWSALAILMFPVLLVSIDNTVLSLALPAMAADLRPNAIQQLWMIDSYPLVLATLLLVMGSLGDRVGRRRLLMVGSTGFAVLSALAAFAPTAGWLIAARVGLGFFGAMLMPSTLALMRAIFPDRRQRQLAVAIWAATFSSGTALGPLFGGVLLDAFDWWGSVFLMAIPLLVPLLLLGRRLIPESGDPNPGPIDIPSAVLSMLTMGPIVLAIKEFAIYGVSAASVVALAGGLIAGAVFVRRQRRLAHPLIDLDLFAIKPFRSSVLINLLSVVALVGFLFIAAQHLQLVLGLTPTAAALVTLPGALAAVVAGIAVVALVRRIGARAAIVTGISGTVLGFALLAFAGAGAVLIGAAFFFVGLGVGATETVSNELILSSAPPERAGAAAAISESAYETGGVLGTALLGGLATAAYRANLVLPAGLSPDDAHEVRETLSGALSVAEAKGGEVGDLLAAAARHAFESGLAIAALLGVTIAVATLLIGRIGLPGRTRV